MFTIDTKKWEIDKREYVPEYLNCSNFKQDYYLSIFDECCKANDAVFKYEEKVVQAA
jgi:hypothetical protein